MACHDGTLYKYSVTGPVNKSMAESLLAIYEKREYSKIDKKVLSRMKKDAGIEMEVIFDARDI